MLVIIYLIYLKVTLVTLQHYTCCKESTCQCRRHKRYRFSPWVRKTPGEGNSNPLQYSSPENSMNREVWWATVHGVTKSWTQLSMHTHICLSVYMSICVCTLKEHNTVKCLGFEILLIGLIYWHCHCLLGWVQLNLIYCEA